MCPILLLRFLLLIPCTLDAIIFFTWKMYKIDVILLKNFSLGNFLTHSITGFLGTRTRNNTNKFSITIIFFFFLAVLGSSSGMWDLVPQTGSKLGPPALGAWSVSHWTTREWIPYYKFLFKTRYMRYLETFSISII